MAAASPGAMPLGVSRNPVLVSVPRSGRSSTSPGCIERRLASVRSRIMPLTICSSTSNVVLTSSAGSSGEPTSTTMIRSTPIFAHHVDRQVVDDAAVDE